MPESTRNPIKQMRLTPVTNFSRLDTRHQTSYIHKSTDTERMMNSTFTGHRQASVRANEIVFQSATRTPMRGSLPPDPKQRRNLNQWNAQGLNVASQDSIRQPRIQANINIH